MNRLSKGSDLLEDVDQAQRAEKLAGLASLEMLCSFWMSSRPPSTVQAQSRRELAVGVLSAGSKRWQKSFPVCEIMGTGMMGLVKLKGCRGVTAQYDLLGHK